MTNTTGQCKWEWAKWQGGRLVGYSEGRVEGGGNCCACK